MIPVFLTAHCGLSLVIMAFMQEWQADIDIIWLTVICINAALFLFEAVTMKGFRL